MRFPTCTLCGVDLERTPQGWRCPSCTFYFNVFRGVASPRPMWGEPKPEEAVPRQPVVEEETFEQWLAERGVTPEMYKDLSRSREGMATQWELKMAFTQRHKREPQFELLPPQR